jgi:hypothetical protein
MESLPSKFILYLPGDRMNFRGRYALFTAKHGLLDYYVIDKVYNHGLSLNPMLLLQFLPTITVRLMNVWAGYLSRYSDWLRAGRSADRIPMGGEIFRTCPDRPWGPTSLLYNGYRVFPGVESGGGVTLTPHPF